MKSEFMTSIFLFYDKNTSINDKSIIYKKVYFCNVNFTRHPRRQIHQSLSKNRLNLSLIYDAEHSVILTELQSALRLSPSISPSPFPTHRCYSIDVNGEDGRWGNKKPSAWEAEGWDMIVIESVYFITLAEEVVPSV